MTRRPSSRVTEEMTPRWLVALTEYAGVTPYTGGIGRHYASLLPALVRAGVDIDLVLFVDDELLTRQAEGGVRIVAHRRLHGVPTALVPIVRAIDFRAIAVSRNYDRVLLPEWGGIGAFLPDALPVVTNLATSMRLSNEVSGIDVRALPAGRRVLVATQNFCEDRQIARSRGVVPISSAMEARNRRLLGGLPLAHVVRNCIDVERVQDLAGSSPLPAAWPSGAWRTVLFLGRLERRKGVVDAADAFRIVAESADDVRFVFAGSPGDSRFEPTKSELLDRIGAGAQGRVTLLGHVPGAELYRAIAVADVVVCPSRWEGFGQVALEAKAIGRPLVVTSGSGYDDFCEDDVDSLVVAPAAPVALAAAILRLLQDHELAARIASAARSGVSRFTADAVAPDVVEAVTALGAR